MSQFEVVIRMPDTPGRGKVFTYDTWRFGTECPSEGQNVYRGTIIGNLSSSNTERMYLTKVYSPVDGVISHMSSSGGHPEVGQIVLKIKTSENVEALSEKLAVSAFQEMIDLFKGTVSHEIIMNCLRRSISIHKVFED